MPTRTLNDRVVAGLKARTERAEYFDRAMPGLAVRVSPTGRKVFVFFYRHSGRLRRQTLGEYPTVLSLADAREKARAAIRKASLGRDPATEQQQARDRTFDALAAAYLEKHAKRKKRSWRDDARMIRQELKAWNGRPVAAIRRADVRELLDAIVDRGAPVRANRVLALVRKMLNFALDQEWVEANPAAKMARPSPESARDRVLTDEELRTVLTYLEAPAPDDADEITHRHWTLQRAALKLRLITAQRGGEVIAMRWSDIDGTWWTIPTEHAKNKLPHRVPLTKPALDVLKRLRADATETEPNVFAGIRGTRQRRGALDGLNIADVRPHDFRRTAASRMASLGVSRLVIAKVLNHAEKGITAVYDRHGYDAEKREALEVWAKELGRLAGKRQGRGVVVPIRRRS